MNTYLELYRYFLSLDIKTSWAQYLNMFVLLIAALVVIVLVDFLIRKILIKLFNQYAIASKTNFDDLLLQNKTPRNIAHIFTWFLAFEFTPVIFVHFEKFERLAELSLEVFGIVLTLWLVRSILNTLKDYFKTLPNVKDKPIDSYIQVFMIFAWFTGIILAVVVVTDTSVVSFFTTLGAASAIILLIFKDTILGFVASIQVSVNDMVRIGDWVTFTKYGADGDVVEINLTTVKVQNFDKTITTIPTYALISDSFKNWRGMVNADGRRIKRALIIKQQSIKFLTQEDVVALQEVVLIHAYLETKQKDIEVYNSENEINKNLLLNGRNLTNIGVFRKYVETYLNQHSAINKDMMIMARQLAPTAQGIPLEIYAFSKDKRWHNYEYIMADIFDHLLASMPYFKLELFELPTSFSETE